MSSVCEIRSFSRKLVAACEVVTKCLARFNFALLNFDYNVK